MGKNTPLVPDWVRSLDALIAAKVPVKALCTLCGAHDVIDLEALREKVGGSYSLWNRRCRCRLTPGCDGCNRFRYVNGMAWPMWDDEGECRSR